eukprot:m.710182 g.710182  ORF g.710182 m.710182 type:complete len:1979 (+) comp58757_c0_seq2:260-6196(+)
MAVDIAHLVACGWMNSLLDASPHLLPAITTMCSGSIFNQFRDARPRVRLWLRPLSYTLCWQLLEPHQAAVEINLFNLRDVRLGASELFTDVTALRRINRTDKRVFSIVAGPDCSSLQYLNLTSDDSELLRLWMTGFDAITRELRHKPTLMAIHMQMLYGRRLEVSRGNGVLVGDLIAELSGCESWRISSLVEHIHKKYVQNRSAASSPFLTQRLAQLLEDRCYLSYANFKLLYIYYQLTFNGEISDIYSQHVNDPSGTMTVEEFQNFLIDSQYDEVQHLDVVVLRESLRLSEEERLDGFVYIETFAEYFFSAYASVTYNSTVISENMTLPLSRYFVASSHNSYLSGKQHGKTANLEMYIQILLSGCRSVEIDCWNGPDGTTIDVVHGLYNPLGRPYAVTSKLEFSEVIHVIRDYAFVASPYPLILSIENHLKPSLQLKMAQVFKSVLGELLLDYVLPDSPNDELPSPDQLKHKILIKNKKKLALSEEPKTPKSPDATFFSQKLPVGEEFVDTARRPSVPLVEPGSPFQRSATDPSEDTLEYDGERDSDSEHEDGADSTPDPFRPNFTYKASSAVLNVARKDNRPRSVTDTIQVRMTSPERTRPSNLSSVQNSETILPPPLDIERTPSAQTYSDSDSAAEGRQASPSLFSQSSSAVGSPRLLPQPLKSPPLPPQPESADALKRTLHQRPTSPLATANSTSEPTGASATVASSVVASPPSIGTPKGAMRRKPSIESPVNLRSIMKPKYPRPDQIHEVLHEGDPSQRFSDGMLSSTSSTRQSAESFPSDSISDVSVRSSRDSELSHSQYYENPAASPRDSNQALKSNSLPRDSGSGSIALHAPPILTIRTPASSAPDTLGTRTGLNDKEDLPRRQHYRNQNGKERVVKELSDMVIYTRGGKIRERDIVDWIRFETTMCICLYEISSVSERDAMRLFQNKKDDFVAYNIYQLCRTYPSNRLDSSNFSPFPTWFSGIQLVAMNYQTLDPPMCAYLAYFAGNGGCGIREKPKSMLSFPSFRSHMMDQKVEMIKLTLAILRADCYPGFTEPWVTAGVVGTKSDVPSVSTMPARFAEAHAHWLQTFAFTIIPTDLTMLHLELHDQIGSGSRSKPVFGVIGQAMIPLSELRCGFRYIQLADSKLNPQPASRLFVFIQRDVMFEDSNQRLDLSPSKQASMKKRANTTSGYTAAFTRSMPTFTFIHVGSNSKSLHVIKITPLSTALQVVQTWLKLVDEVREAKTFALVFVSMGSGPAAQEPLEHESTLQAFINDHKRGYFQVIPSDLARIQETANSSLQEFDKFFDLKECRHEFRMAQTESKTIRFVKMLLRSDHSRQMVTRSAILVVGPTAMGILHGETKELIVRQELHELKSVQPDKTLALALVFRSMHIVLEAKSTQKVIEIARLFITRMSAIKPHHQRTSVDSRSGSLSQYESLFSAFVAAFRSSAVTDQPLASVRVALTPTPAYNDSTCPILPLGVKLPSQAILDHAQTALKRWGQDRGVVVSQFSMKLCFMLESEQLLHRIPPHMSIEDVRKSFVFDTSCVYLLCDELMNQHRLTLHATFDDSPSGNSPPPGEGSARSRFKSKPSINRQGGHQRLAAAPTLLVQDCSEFESTDRSTDCSSLSSSMESLVNDGMAYRERSSVMVLTRQESDLFRNTRLRPGELDSTDEGRGVEDFSDSENTPLPGIALFQQLPRSRDRRSPKPRFDRLTDDEARRARGRASFRQSATSDLADESDQELPEEIPRRRVHKAQRVSEGSEFESPSTEPRHSDLSESDPQMVRIPSDEEEVYHLPRGRPKFSDVSEPEPGKHTRFSDLDSLDYEEELAMREFLPTSPRASSPSMERRAQSSQVRRLNKSSLLEKRRSREALEILPRERIQFWREKLRDLENFHAQCIAQHRPFPETDQFCEDRLRLMVELLHQLELLRAFNERAGITTADPKIQQREREISAVEKELMRLFFHDQPAASEPVRDEAEETDDDSVQYC